MHKFSRRQFCVMSGAGVLVGACGSGANGGGGGDGGADDLSVPMDLVNADLIDPTCAVGGRLHAGPASSFAVDTATFFHCARVFICRDSLGLYAMSGSCTHEGCDVAFSAANLRFDCPCHQSIFDFNGNVLAAPALTPLPHVAVSLDGNGNVVVDVTTRVPANTRLSGLD
jgi:nitrite reductase/ring-hydroxylating ferredoxin subunit